MNESNHVNELRNDVMYARVPAGMNEANVGWTMHMLNVELARGSLLCCFAEFKQAIRKPITAIINQAKGEHTAMYRMASFVQNTQYSR